MPAAHPAGLAARASILLPASALCALALLMGIARADMREGGALSAAEGPNETVASAIARLDPKRALATSQDAIGRTLSAYTLRDVDGQPFELARLRGKPLIVSFVYTGCFQICPSTTRALKRAVESALSTFGTDRFNVVTVGFNQPFDTPLAMRAYANAQGVQLPNWYFLSPDPATLSALAANVGFSFAARSGGFDHVAQVSVVDPSGRVYAQIYGDAFAPPQLIDPLKELLTGAPRPGEGVRALIDRVRLLCTYYDPATGRYRYNYSILIEIAGGITGLLALAAFVWRHRRAV
ncbi:MAG TPA: SCO family protein [Burkholderiales bacterium]|nr:SCO family protein [Burkholderiales bacterium]